MSEAAQRRQRDDARHGEPEGCRGRRAIIAVLASSCLGCLGCGSAPMATTVSKLPERGETSARAERYELSPPSTTVEADVSAVGSYTLEFPTLSGELLYEAASPTKSQVDVRIDMQSLTSSLDIVESIAKSPDFLDVSSYPEARFASRTLQIESDGTGRLVGEFELKGVSKPIAVPLSLSADRCWIVFESAFTIDRRDYKVESDTTVDGVVSDDVEIRIAGTLKRQDAPADCKPRG